MRGRCLQLLTAVVFWMSGGSAAAGELATADLFSEAEMVFDGTVSKITYGMSRAANKGERPVPLTFVTFTVQRVFAGPDARTVKLRLVGGPLQDGKIMVASELPAFDVGDRDVVFVRGNGIRACPLVGCARGRIRLVRGHAYDEDGSELRLEAGELRRGRVLDLEEVRTHTIAGHTFRSVAPPPKLDVEKASPPVSKAAPPLREERLLEWVAQRAAASRDSKARTAREVADPREDVAMGITPTPPPPPHAPSRRSVTP
jgi:hypothetical protein